MPNISLPLFEGVDAPSAPYQGTSVETRSASLSGAIQGLDRRGEKLVKLFMFIQREGPCTLNEMSAGLGYPLSSICSLHAILKPQLDTAGYQIVKIGRNTTKRTLWTVTKEIR